MTSGIAPISVVIPAYNAAGYLADAIHSVLSQTLLPSEIIVVDDGSTDGTREIASSFVEVDAVWKEHGGPGAARNFGARRSSKKFLCFLDADDLWPTFKLERQMAVLNRDEECDIVFGAAIEFRELGADGNPIVVRGPIEAQLPGSLLVRREVFDKVGFFREDRKIGDVIDWYSRTIELGLSSAQLPDVLLWRRLHANNLGRTERDPAGDYLHVLRDIINRRRGSS